ncbi:SUMO-conjugating enzyme UBC9, partial [Capsicum annuum]
IIESFAFPFKHDIYFACVYCNRNPFFTLFLLLIVKNNVQILQTDWEGGHYPLTIYFSEDYPSQPPKCMLPKGFFHINVYPSGDVCLSILNAATGWSPAITVKQILLGIQELLEHPNPSSSAQFECNKLYMEQDKTEYKRRVKEQAKQYPALI